METFIKKTILLIGAMLGTSAMAQEPDLYIYEYKEVIDTAKADSIYNAFISELQGKLTQAYTKPYVEKISVINQLMEYERSREKIKDDNLWRELMRYTYDKAATEKDQNQISKRKVPSGFSERVLLPAKRQLQSTIDSYNPWLPSRNQVFREHMTRFEYLDPERGTCYVGMESVTEPQKKVAVAKPNPAHRDNYFNGNLKPSTYEPWSEYQNHKWDEAQLSQGWEWAKNGEMQTKSVYFPEELSYRFHPAHPEYRFAETGNINRYDAYDDKGTLVRAGNIVNSGRVYEQMYNEVMMAICKRDFLANKYDINSAKPETLTALRITFGMQDFVDARYKKYTKMAQDARDEIVAATTVAQYTAAKKKQAEALNVLLEYVAKEREPQALNYIKQLKADHTAGLSYLYKIERVSNTEFKVYFLNDKMECGCVALMKWRNKAPYEAEYEVELLPCETITIRR